MSPGAPATQVIILACSALPRLAWEALLSRQPRVAIWGTAANLDDILALPQTNELTAVLLDLPEPLTAWATQISENFPEYGLLYLVQEYDLEQIVTLLQAGITGVLSRDATLPELIRGLLAAARGEIVLPPALAGRALAALARGKVRPRQTGIESLSEREQDVLSLLAQGMTNKEIAQSLFLSVRTIEAHLHRIYAKLEVSTRTEAVLWAVHHGFV